MGSPIVPILANIFLYHESKWLKDCAKDFKPVYNKIFLNDILFNKPEIWNKPEIMRNFFLQVINKKHKNMIFLIEAEINGSLSFLDIKKFPENEKFVTGVFRKKCF